MTLYEPQEDSHLLEQYVLKLATGSVLDMGSGSGLLANTASKKPDVTSVLAVDIDQESIDHMTQKLQTSKKITIKHSDLFSKIDEKFDTIIFNPPYLPQDPDDSHQALYGGVQGYELIEKFLEQAKNYLTTNGVILLLFSSLTNKERIIQIMKQQNYYFEELGMQAHFFEQLYVYKLGAKHG